MWWESSDLPVLERVSLSDLAVSPTDYIDEIVTVTGFIGESISPDATFTSAYLTDHPGNAAHQMQLLIQSATGRWIESDSKVEVSGILTYQETSLRWALLTQGPNILIDNSYQPPVTRLDWSMESTWSYDSGTMVDIAGTLIITAGEWNLFGPSGNSICVIPTQADIVAASNETFNGTVFDASGRLMWSDDRNTWCVDANEGGGENLVNPMNALTMQAILSADPASMLVTPQKYYTLNTYMKYAFEPLDTEGYFVDSQTYTFGQTTIAMTFPGTRTEWIESGQGIVANVTVAWDDEDMRMRLMVGSYNLTGNPPAASTLLWDDGATQWGYSKNQFVLLNGKAVQHDDGWYLERPGSEQSVKLNVRLNAIGTDSLHENQSLTWTGRLRQIEHPSQLAMVFSLDEADALDTDGDRLGDSVEDALGYNPLVSDTDGDGTDDRQEAIDSTQSTSA